MQRINRKQRDILCSTAAYIKTLNFKENTALEVETLRANIHYNIKILDELGVPNRVRAIIFSECESRSSLDMYFSDILRNNNIIVVD